MTVEGFKTICWEECLNVLFLWIILPKRGEMIKVFNKHYNWSICLSLWFCPIGTPPSESESPPTYGQQVVNLWYYGQIGARWPYNSRWWSPSGRGTLKKKHNFSTFWGIRVDICMSRGFHFLPQIMSKDLLAQKASLT